MVKPNLFIIGAMKSGTTSLHNYLNQHPDIFMCEPKEPGYFVEELNFNKGEAWYTELFSAANNATYIGESSTHYAKLPTYKGVPERIKAFNSSAKIIYIMRDPLERIISHYWYNLAATAMGYDKRFGIETRDIMTAVANNPEYISFSDYAFQLSPYINNFGSENIYTLIFEDLVANPHNEVNAIFSWLEMDALTMIPSETKVWNKTPSSIQRFKGKGGLQKFRSSRLWDLLSPLVPASLKQRAKSAALENIEKDTPPELLEYLRPKLLPKTEVLERLLQTEFKQWKTLYNDKI